MSFKLQKSLVLTYRLISTSGFHPVGGGGGGGGGDRGEASPPNFQTSPPEILTLI